MERTWKATRKQIEAQDDVILHLTRLCRAVARKDIDGIRFEREALIRLGQKPPVDEWGKAVGPRERYWQEYQVRKVQGAEFRLDC